MSLSVGDRLGPYEILAQIGAGGMGEVYRAKDTRLGREVAVKVSKEQFSERFEREAHAVAALNHPNICTLHDVGPNYLVMEYVEGEAPQGPLPLDEALKIAHQIGDALEAAHEKGIVHRDLKPANIRLKPDGTVKVLDFGLAKLGGTPTVQTEDSPTLTLAATQAGVILGTAAYMSPEQARGKIVDKRADIWAFGVVLYELLTGKRLFQGEDVSHTMAAVIMQEPRYDGIPANVQRALKSCLEKDPKKRLRDIGDFWRLLEEVGQAPGLPRTQVGDLRHWTAAGVFALALAAVSFVHFRETPPPPEQTLRYTIAAPENSALHSFAISPDGRTLVMAATVNGKRQLWLRAMDALQAQPMPFTEDATYPFWSPDSRYIGFFAQGKLKKVAASGGPSQSLCDAPNGRGGSWNRDDVIVFSPDSGGIQLQRVAAAGGVPLDVTKNKAGLRHPVFLPDGRHFLYLVNQAAAETSGVYVASLDGKENRRILADSSGAVFAPAPRNNGRTGHLLFVRENTLMALPFDAANAQPAGDVFPVAEGVSLTTNNSYVPATVSEGGVLLYQTGGTAGGAQIGWYDRTGKSLGPVGAPGTVFDPALSPDEKSVAFRRDAGALRDIWVRDLARGAETRLTSDASVHGIPLWSPKGDRILFMSDHGNRTGIYNVHLKSSSGGDQDELLLPSSLADIPTQWSRDGRFIVYSENDPKSKYDLWVLPIEGPATERKPIPFLRTEFNEMFGQLSPDSRWMAFTSDRSGRREVYVRPFPPGEGEWTISIAGGEQPRWRGDGKEMFFVAADGKMMAVPVKASAGAKPVFEAGVPAALFGDVRMPNPGPGFQYDVTADGKRFLINMTNTPAAASTPPLSVVTNWLAGLKK